MVPAAAVDQTIADLLPALEPDDILIDGGNSYYIDDIRRAKELAPKRIHYVDVGTSGGVWGLERGYCMMIGGEKPVVAAPRPDLCDAGARQGRHSATPGREKLAASTAEQGYLHCGPNGAGHFVKMVHNGIEYGIMAAYAEGLGHPALGQCRQADPCGRCRDDAAARSRALPVRSQPARHRGVVAARQRHRLMAFGPDRHAFAKDPELAGFAGRVSDSGEGRWTIKAAIDEAVPAHVLSAALYDRFARAARPSSPTSCFRRCATSSAATSRSRRGNRSQKSKQLGAGHGSCRAGRRTRRCTRRCAVVFENARFGSRKCLVVRLARREPGKRVPCTRSG